MITGALGAGNLLTRAERQQSLDRNIKKNAESELMLIHIPHFLPVQLVFSPFYDATLLSMLNALNLQSGKKNTFLYIGLDVAEGDFLDRHYYFRAIASSSLCSQFFSAVGIRTANGVSIDSTLIEGRRLLVDVIRQNPSMMYEKVVGFRPGNKQ